MSKEKNEGLNLAELMKDLDAAVDGKGEVATPMDSADIIELATIAKELVEKRNALADVGRMCTAAMDKRGDDITAQAPFLATAIAIGGALNQIDEILQIHDTFMDQVRGDMKDHKGCGDCEGCKARAEQEESKDESPTVH
jgi:hypothetical protein